MAFVLHRHTTHLLSVTMAVLNIYHKHTQKSQLYTIVALLPDEISTVYQRCTTYNLCCKILEEVILEVSML